MATKEEIAILNGHSHSVNSICINKIDTILASGSSDMTIKL